MSLLIIAITAILILLLGFVWFMGAHSQKPKRKPIDRLPDIPYENVSWQSGGQTIQGWFIPAAREEGSGLSPAIVIAHGWSSYRSSMLRYVKPLHDAGYALLLYDARGHGESGHVRAASGVTMRDDLRAALDELCRRPEIDRKRIGVLGHSLGAFAAVLALGSGEHRIKALVTDAMPSRLITMVSAELARRKLPLFPFVQLIPLVWWLRTGVPRIQYDPILALNQSTAPILMIHSRGDNFIPWTELAYVLGHIDRKVDHLYLDVEGHSNSYKDEAFWAHVVPFFNKRLKPEPAPAQAELVDLYQI